MVQKQYEKLLSADIDSHVVDKFLRQASERGFTKKRVLAAAVKLWTRLPLEVQARLLSQDIDAESLPTLFDMIDEQGRKTSPDTSTDVKK